MLLFVLCAEIGIAIVILALIIFSNRLLTNKLALVPDPDDIGVTAHPLIGINIQHALSDPIAFQSSSTIMMVISPSCHTCYGELQDFLKITNEMKNQLPFLGLVVEEEEGAAESFIEEFGSRVRLRQVDGDLTRRLNIQWFPLAFLVDSEGTITRVQMPLKRLVRWYLKMMRSESGR